MFKANLKRVSGTMFNVFAKIDPRIKKHAERKRERDERDPKRDQCKMKEKKCRSEVRKRIAWSAFMILM